MQDKFQIIIINKSEKITQALAFDELTGQMVAKQINYVYTCDKQEVYFR